MKVSDLTFRQSYLSDPASWRALIDLLQDTFHINIGALDNLGGMDPSSMPFGWFDEKGVLAANLSVFSMPMMVDGRRLKVAALQSGAVRPAHQGKGLYRHVMQMAFAWIDESGFDLAMLYTDKPAMYEPYGFKTVPVHKFTGPSPQPGPASSARALDIDNSADVTLLTGLINGRAPASNLFSPLSHRRCF
jgi:predicted N-acetyltransferase YhbS